MRILVIGNIWPQKGHTVRAANVVIFELLRALSQSKNYEIGYLRVKRLSDPVQTRDENLAQKELESMGVAVLQELRLDDTEKKRPLWVKALLPKMTDFYPESIFTEKIKIHVEKFSPDLLLVPWSEWLTGACAKLPLKKVAYYGNPDHKAGRWRLEFDRKHGIRQLSYFRLWIALRYLEKFHLANMSRYDLLADVAKNDADYYRSKGHKNAHYIQNLWIDRFGEEFVLNRLGKIEGVPNQTYKIIANIGQLGATANRYGLELVAKEIAPLLRHKLANVSYEIHILGNGEIPGPLKKYFQYPEFKIRGFVEDIDSEIFDSAVFLCMNNASPFQVCHTRYLHAWSLGACVVGHENVALSIPEMEHGKNCLLGKSFDEIADLITRAIYAPSIRRQMGLNGYKTFKETFMADSVARNLLGLLNLKQ